MLTIDVNGKDSNLNSSIHYETVDSPLRTKTDGGVGGSGRNRRLMEQASYSRKRRDLAPDDSSLYNS